MMGNPHERSNKLPRSLFPLRLCTVSGAFRIQKPICQVFLISSLNKILGLYVPAVRRSLPRLVGNEHTCTREVQTQLGKLTKTNLRKPSNPITLFAVSGNSTFYRFLDFSSIESFLRLRGKGARVTSLCHADRLNQRCKYVHEKLATQQLD
jgi:hypothetical protein